MTRYTSLAHADIARHAARGRRLQARAVRAGLASAYRWILAAAVGTIRRRAFDRGAVVARTGCNASA